MKTTKAKSFIFISECGDKYPTYVQEGYVIPANKPYIEILVNKVIGSQKAYNNIIKNDIARYIVMLRKDQWDTFVRFYKLISYCEKEKMSDNKIKDALYGVDDL